MYDVMVATCEKHGYSVHLEVEARGWCIRVLDPSGQSACRTLIGERDEASKNAGAVSVLLYLKPIFSLERLAS